MQPLPFTLDRRLPKKALDIMIAGCGVDAPAAALVAVSDDVGVLLSPPTAGPAPLSDAFDLSIATHLWDKIHF